MIKNIIAHGCATLESPDFLSSIYNYIILIAWYQKMVS